MLIMINQPLDFSGGFLLHLYEAASTVKQIAGSADYLMR
jgi:hypothetical protein